jgi:hypothetical protein
MAIAESECLMDLKAFVQAGQALSGSEDEWKRPLARTLGPHHPSGARDSIDPRLPFRWASGERDIPAWVVSAMARLLRERATYMVTAAEALERASAEVDVLTEETI